jgi:flagellar hook assembly protein FlgD
MWLTRPDQNRMWGSQQGLDYRRAYDVGSAGHVTLEVYDALGRVVKVIDDTHRWPGPYVARWDGCNAEGQRVASGVYFCRINAAGFTATRKMIVVR